MRSYFQARYAAKDAQDFAARPAGAEGRDISRRRAAVRTDRDVTTIESGGALSWLERQVTSRDVGLVFLAGHGVTDEKHRYCFLTADATATTAHRG